MMGHHYLLIIAFFFEAGLPHSIILFILLSESDSPLNDAVQIADRVLHQYNQSLQTLQDKRVVRSFVNGHLHSSLLQRFDQLEILALHLHVSQVLKGLHVPLAAQFAAEFQINKEVLIERWVSSGSRWEMIQMCQLVSSPLPFSPLYPQRLSFFILGVCQRMDMTACMSTLFQSMQRHSRFGRLKQAAQSLVIDVIPMFKDIKLSAEFLRSPTNLLLKQKWPQRLRQTRLFSPEKSQKPASPSFWDISELSMMNILVLCNLSTNLPWILGQSLMEKLTKLLSGEMFSMTISVMLWQHSRQIASRWMLLLSTSSKVTSLSCTFSRLRLLSCLVLMRLFTKRLGIYIRTCNREVKSSSNSPITKSYSCQRGILRAPLVLIFKGTQAFLILGKQLAIWYASSNFIGSILMPLLFSLKQRLSSTLRMSLATSKKYSRWVILFSLRELSRLTQLMPNQLAQDKYSLRMEGGRAFMNCIMLYQEPTSMSQTEISQSLTILGSMLQRTQTLLLTFSTTNLVTEDNSSSLLNFSSRQLITKVLFYLACC